MQSSGKIYNQHVNKQNKKDLYVIKNEKFSTQTQLPSYRGKLPKRQTLSDIILSKQIKNIETQHHINVTNTLMSESNTYKINESEISKNIFTEANEIISNNDSIISTIKKIDSPKIERLHSYVPSRVNNKEMFQSNNIKKEISTSPGKTKISKIQRCGSWDADNKHKRGIIDFYKAPMKRFKRSYSVESKEKKYDNEDCLDKIIKIQSTLRKFFLRKKLYSKIMTYYMYETFVIHIENINAVMQYKLLLWSFTKIYNYRKRVYTITRKEKNLLDELRKRKITSFKDLVNYFNWLSKTKI